jgi:hypothetical protein
MFTLVYNADVYYLVHSTSQSTQLKREQELGQELQKINEIQHESEWVIVV